jgi:hypothetical protein
MIQTIGNGTKIEIAWTNPATTPSTQLREICASRFLKRIHGVRVRKSLKSSRSETTRDPP